MNLESILKEYSDNTEYYNKVTNNIKTTLKGRICHHSVVILNILTKLTDIKTYLEIGVHNGTSMAYAISNNLNMKCIGVDLFEDTINRYAHDNLQYERTANNILNINKSNTLSLIKGNSFLEETIQKVDSILNKDQVDLFFIDGDHSYKGIKNDFNNYEKFVKTGGLIVIDDFNPKYPGIIKFCNELKSDKFEKIGVFMENELILRKK